MLDFDSKVNNELLNASLDLVEEKQKEASLWVADYQ